MAQTSASAQERFLLEGLADGEFFAADADEDEGGEDPDGLFWRARLQLWAALQLSPRVQAYALAEAEADDFSGSWESEVDIEEAALRFSSNSAPYYEIDVGRILAPVEGVLSYPLSIQNPLIGPLNSHYESYPLGIQLSGSTRRFDYRLALVDEPVPDVGLSALEPDSAFRPELVAGFTPFVGFRIGVSYARGPYLNSYFNAHLPAGADWKDYDQTFSSLDVEFSRGYAELRGGFSSAEYDLPYRADRAKATDAWFEFTYTWTPRLYGTVRLQRTKYEPVDFQYHSYQAGPRQTGSTVEIGFGYRFSADTQVKLEFRNYNSGGDEYGAGLSHGEAYAYLYAGGDFPADTAVAVQLSHHFDFRRRYRAGD
jgi:hypothetical protein